jgi:outer membrane protein assembly factor BamD
MAKFKEEDYLEAIEDFKIVTLQYQGSQFGDDAQYYLAESRYVRSEFVLAAYEYDVLLRTAPTSEYVARARFRKATCFYELSPESYRDQDYSHKAIDEYQGFLEYHPVDSLAPTAEARIHELNTKLAKKDFENGAIYLTMQYNKAALYYFDLVLEKYHDTPYAELAQLRKAEALFNRKKFAEARSEMSKFIAKFPASAHRLEADGLRARIDKEESGANEQRLRADQRQNSVQILPVQ